MNTEINPYRGLPPYQYWRTGVANVSPGQFDPVVTVKFQIERDDLISTMGSCFAQHLAKHISNTGFNYMVFEPLRIDEDENVISQMMASQFSARYGNIYTVRQALQLLDRSLGWHPQDDVWVRDEKYFDAFRPNVFTNGFSSEQALVEERERHLNKVLDVFSKSSVIVFTLGLTEAWVSRQDGAVYPMAPGVVAGSMTEDQYEFKNFEYDEIRKDLESWCTRLKSMNPAIRILLTVSPVALNATFENQNVWTSTTYSKSVLRAVAGDVSKLYSYVDYFPSYEIISSPLMQGRYLEDDMREVKEIGVQHVMRVFEDHYLLNNKIRNQASGIRDTKPTNLPKSESISDIFCDEDLLDPN